MRWRKTREVTLDDASRMLVNFVPPPGDFPIRLLNMRHAIRVLCTSDIDLSVPWKYGWQDRTGFYNKPIWIQDCLPVTKLVIPGLRIGRLFDWSVFIVEGKKCTKAEAIAFAQSQGWSSQSTRDQVKLLNYMEITK